MSATKIPCARCGIPKAHTNWDDICHQCVALEKQQKDLTRIREIMESLSFDLKIEKGGEVDLALVEIYELVVPK